MAEGTTERVALMAIRPVFAHAILNGTKLVEFRKRRLAADISRVLVYATSPVQRVIGAFSIERTVVAPPAEIWSSYGDVGVIERDAFDRYYSHVTSAVALKIRDAERFATPLRLADLMRIPSPPQSFIYLTMHEAIELQISNARRLIDAEQRAPQLQPA